MLDSLWSIQDPSLLVFFSLLSQIQGDCGSPPKLKNSVPFDNVEGKNFRPGESVVYRCLDNFYNIYGKLDVTTCLSDSTWSDIKEFCQRSCYTPPRYRFARPRREDLATYYPAKTRVTYVCRPGYDTIPGISSVVTCLESNHTWTNLPVFCEGKSCGHPGTPENGEVVILTDFLFSAKVNFICAEGYILVGLSSVQCVLKGDGVEWQSKPPECQRQTRPTKSPTSENKPSNKETTKPGTGFTMSHAKGFTKNESGTARTTGIGVVSVVGVIVLIAAIIVFIKCIHLWHPSTS